MNIFVTYVFLLYMYYIYTSYLLQCFGTTKCRYLQIHIACHATTIFFCGYNFYSLNWWLASSNLGLNWPQFGPTRRWLNICHIFPSKRMQWFTFAMMRKWLPRRGAGIQGFFFTPFNVGTTKTESLHLGLTRKYFRLQKLLFGGDRGFNRWVGLLAFCSLPFCLRKIETYCTKHEFLASSRSFPRGFHR